MIDALFYSSWSGNVYILSGRREYVFIFSSSSKCTYDCRLSVDRWIAHEACEGFERFV